MDQLNSVGSPATSGVLRDFVNQSLRRSDRPGTQIADDSVEISALAGFLNRLAELPDNRARKIVSIRNQIQDGTYLTQQKLDAATHRLLADLQL